MTSDFRRGVVVISADPKVLPGGWDSTWELPACFSLACLYSFVLRKPGQAQEAQIFTVGEGVQGPYSGF